MVANLVVCCEKDLLHKFIDWKKFRSWNFLFCSSFFCSLFWFILFVYLITLFCQGFREEQNRNARCIYMHVGPWNEKTWSHTSPRSFHTHAWTRLVALSRTWLSGIAFALLFQCLSCKERHMQPCSCVAFSFVTHIAVWIGGLCHTCFLILFVSLHCEGVRFVNGHQWNRRTIAS